METGDGLLGTGWCNGIGSRFSRADAAEFHFQRTEQRDIRKAKVKEKKEQNQNEALLQAVKVSSQTVGPHSSC